ncbi:MAG TPA: hypothetical protein VI072_35515 [Polyangiaceae bacterium]
MIEKFERQYFSGADTQSVVQSIQYTLYQSGIQVSQVAPNSWTGRAGEVSYGLRLKATLTVQPAPGGFVIDLRIGSDIETNGIILLVVLWLVFFPAAIVIALLAYQDVSGRQTRLAQAVWGPIANRMMAPPNMGYYPQQMGGPPAPGAGVPPGTGQPPPAGYPPRPGS